MSDYRKGSLGEAEQKSLTKAKWIMAAVTVILLLMNNFGLFHTYLYMWHEKAGGLAKALGTGLYIVALIVLPLESWISNKARNETLWYVIWILALLAAIGVSCGFNFTL